MEPSWVRDPIGLPIPALIASTPATKVVLTAPPIPGSNTPSFPLGALILFLLFGLEVAILLLPL